MKKTLFAVIMVLAALTIVGCSDNKKPIENASSKQFITRKVEKPSYFNKVVVDGVVDVSFRQNVTPAVSIKGRRNVALNVVARIDGETLMIGLSTKDLLRFDRSEKAQVYISSPDLIGVVMKGAGSFTSHGEVDTDTLNVQLLGAGDIEFESVICDKADFNIRGAGNIDVDKLTSQATEISLLGVGKAEIDFVNSGDVSCILKGVGNIELEGDVRSLQTSKQGTGKIDTDDLRVEK